MTPDWRRLMEDWDLLGWRVAAEIFNENETGGPESWIRARHERIFETIGN